MLAIVTSLGMGHAFVVIDRAGTSSMRSRFVYLPLALVVRLRTRHLPTCESPSGSVRRHASLAMKAVTAARRESVAAQVPFSATSGSGQWPLFSVARADPVARSRDASRRLQEADRAGDEFTDVRGVIPQAAHATGLPCDTVLFPTT